MCTKAEIFHPVEHYHQVQKRERAKTSNIQNFFQANQLINLRRGAYSNPGVAENLEQFEKFEQSSKRKLTEDSRIRQTAKKNAKKVVKDERLTKGSR